MSDGEEYIEAIDDLLEGSIELPTTVSNKLILAGLRSVNKKVEAVSTNRESIIILQEGYKSLVQYLDDLKRKSDRNDLVIAMATILSALIMFMNGN